MNYFERLFRHFRRSPRIVNQSEDFDASGGLGSDTRQRHSTPSEPERCVAISPTIDNELRAYVNDVVPKLERQIQSLTAQGIQVTPQTLSGSDGFHDHLSFQIVELTSRLNRLESQVGRSDQRALPSAPLPGHVPGNDADWIARVMKSDKAALIIGLTMALVALGVAVGIFAR